MKTILNIIVCMTLLAGCEKEEPETTISGVVVNYGTLKPIDSVLVTVISGAGKGTFGDTKVLETKFQFIQTKMESSQSILKVITFSCILEKTNTGTMKKSLELINHILQELPTQMNSLNLKLFHILKVCFIVKIAWQLTLYI